MRTESPTFVADGQLADGSGGAEPSSTAARCRACIAGDRLTADQHDLHADYDSTAPTDLQGKSVRLTCESLCPVPKRGPSEWKRPKRGHPALSPHRSATDGLRSISPTPPSRRPNSRKSAHLKTRSATPARSIAPASSPRSPYSQACSGAATSCSPTSTTTASPAAVPI